MKILLINEFSGLQNELKNALIQLGHDVTLAAANDFYKKYPADINLGYGDNLYSYTLRQAIYPFVHLNKMTGYDVVHLVSPYIIPRLAGINLYLLKFLKKHNGIVTFSGAGDDPFFVTYSEKTMRYSPIPWSEKIDRGGKLHHMRDYRQLQMMQQFVETVDRVFPIIYEYYSTFCEAGYKDKTEKPIPIPIDINKYSFSTNFSSKKLVFFHGLTRPGFKGTFLIDSAFKKLSSKYPNDVECWINGEMNFADYMKILSKTNISVDQVFSYSLAMNALYSMAQGKIVCGGAEKESSILYDGLLPPVFNLEPNEDQILSVFENILENRSTLESMAHMSREFVEKHHNGLRIAQQYIDCWNAI